ncbi:hypothetical protein CR513_58464, partial [Mucuna pruriens]
MVADPLTKGLLGINCNIRIKSTTLAPQGAKPPLRDTKNRQHWGLGGKRSTHDHKEKEMRHKLMLFDEAQGDEAQVFTIFK